MTEQNSLRCSDLREWLCLQGLGKYLSCFLDAGIDLSLVPHLQDDDLKNIGIQTLGARRKIMLEASELFPDKLGNGHCQNDAALKKPGDVLKIFQSSQFSTKGGDGDCKKRKPMQSIDVNIKGSDFDRKNRIRIKTRSTTKVVPFRKWQTIPGTNFIVDRFNNLPPGPPGQRKWFLTHFHADHYKGLGKKFAGGMLFCTSITATLVKDLLKVPSNVVREVAIGETIMVENVSVTFLDANHCPGAAMLLFRVPGRLPVLHTGDSRLSHFHQIQELIEVRGNVDVVLDTTYCDPKYTFPPQEEALRFVVDAVKAESFNSRTLFMFGSYTIGKERVYLAAAKHLGLKIYVSATKLKILKSIGLSNEELKMFTTDDQESNLHVVPIWKVSHKHMASALKFYGNRFENVVGFQPTGWAHTRNTKSKATGAKRKKRTIITYQVPYSEHSSFSELVDFISWLRPRSIVPSVNNDLGGPKSEHMIRLLRGRE